MLNQTFKDFELILVNDGSSDKSEEVCLSYQDPRVFYLAIPNSGVATARNTGFRKSIGKYIAFLDSDDVWLSERLQATVDALDSDSLIGLVHTHMAVVDEASSRTGTVHVGKDGDVLDDLLSWNGCVIPAPSSVLIRETCLRCWVVRHTPFHSSRSGALFSYCSSLPKLAWFPIHWVCTGCTAQICISILTVWNEEHIYTYNKASELGLFSNEKFKRLCFSNMYMILAGSYWGHTSNKRRLFS